jgi:hypothetical protein
MVAAESPASVPKNSSNAGRKSPLERPCRYKSGRAQRDLRTAAHVGWHDHALEAPTLSVLLDPAVVDPWGTGTSTAPAPQRISRSLALPGVPIANDQGASMLDALLPGCLDVGLDLYFSSAWASIFLAAWRAISSRSSISSSRAAWSWCSVNIARCILPTGVGAPELSFTFLGRYTACLAKSLIHNF